MPGPYESPYPDPPAPTELYQSMAAVRPSTIGPDSGPNPPFPLRMSGKVTSGFGRGSSELGIPTANLPVDGPECASWLPSADSGVYFGWASVSLPDESGEFGDATDRWRVYPMVMSIGYNPYYKNTVRSAEVHVMRKIHVDLRGREMRLLILEYVREEKDYPSLEALVCDIRIDIEVARRSLEREGWMVREVDERGRLDGSWLVRKAEEGREEKQGEAMGKSG
ncbi:hypothetical protein DL546_008724 [Coniochaeta pulveracea]|uniref:Riboflavin kinase n=1 Tax=Coniochaeta pulveracea TaxID=177199 RepID=A0A420YL51_9PEZI|nr:hypothetical protein DL546_008724 [Coniochaeta pulveracea]